MAKLHIALLFAVATLVVCSHDDQHDVGTVPIDSREGENVRLPCRFPAQMGTSDILLYWIRSNSKNAENVAIDLARLINDYTLDASIEQGRYDLIIPSAVYLRDNGSFVCNVRKKSTSSTLQLLTYQLTILIPPGIPKIEPESPIAKEGKPFELTCQSAGGSPAPYIEWLRNGIPVPSQWIPSHNKNIPTKSVLSLRPNASDDGLPYTCRVSSRALSRMPLETQVTLSVQYVPRVTVGPHNPLLVLKGADAHLFCNYQSNPAPMSVIWRHNNLLLSNQANHSILRIEPGDSGEYECIVDNGIMDDQGKAGAATLQMQVLYAPIISVPAQLEPEAGSPLSLNCKVDAQPSAHAVSWYRILDNAPPKKLSEEATLEISSLAPTDSGMYACRAENRLAPSDGSGVYLQSANASIQLKVQTAPSSVSIFPPGEQLVAISGHPYTLQCRTPFPVHPEPVFRWWREGDEGNSLSKSANYTLVIPHIRNEGRYFCEAKNDLGKSTPVSVQLIINEPASIIIPMKPQWIKPQGERGFSLTCRARGKPTPRVMWLHDGRPIELHPQPNIDGTDLEPPMHRVDTLVDNVHMTQSVLYFESSRRRNGDELTASDHGRYQCVFDNELPGAEPARAETYLRIEHTPVLKHLHNRVAFDLNQTAVLRCEMSAYPPPTFEWYFENRLLESRSHKYSMNVSELADDVWLATLNVHGMTGQDYGEYTCRAWNRVDEMDDERTIIKLLERSEPEAPSDLTVLDMGAEWALLGWTAGFDGGYPAGVDYYLSIASEDSRYTRWRNESCRNANPCRVGGLRSRTNYAFKVMAANRRGHSAFSDSVRTVTKVSIKDIPTPSMAPIYDALHTLVSFQLDTQQLPLIARVEAVAGEQPSSTTKMPTNDVTESKVSEQTSNVMEESMNLDWSLISEQPLKEGEQEHVLYLPSGEGTERRTYKTMRITLCLASNTTMCGHTQQVKMDLVASFYRENKVYTIEQLMLIIALCLGVALGSVALLSVACVRQKDKLAAKKDAYDSDSDAESARDKVNTISGNYFSEKSLVDDTNKMLPPPMYSTSPNTPTQSVNNTLNNNLMLPTNGYGPQYAGTGYYLPTADPSPNGSNETAQSDLWVMKNDMLNEQQQQQQQALYGQTGQAYGQPQEMLMNGLSTSYHHLAGGQTNYGAPMDYSYSYYQGQPEHEMYPQMGEDAYTIKNSLYGAYYDENGYGQTTKSGQMAPPPLPPMDGLDYSAYAAQQQQPQLVYDDDAMAYGSNSGDANRVIREIIV